MIPSRKLVLIYRPTFVYRIDSWKHIFLSRDVFFCLQSEGAEKSLFWSSFTADNNSNARYCPFFLLQFLKQKSFRQVSGPATKIVCTVSDCMKVTFCRCYSNNKREWRMERRKLIWGNLFCAHNWIKSIYRCGLNGICTLCNVPEITWKTTIKEKCKKRNIYYNDEIGINKKHYSLQKWPKNQKMATIIN